MRVAANSVGHGAKVVILGNSGVGKTSIISAYINPSQALPFNQSTIGCNYQEVKIPLDGEEVALRLWDTAGQEVYQSIVPIYIRDAIVAILVYDRMDKYSFQALDRWISVLNEENPSKASIIVVCNKCDIQGTPVIPDDSGLEYAQSIKAAFFKVSALDKTGISTLFEEVAREVIEYQAHHTTVHRDDQMESDKESCC